MKPRHRRIVFVGIAVVAVALAALMITQALRSNIAYFYSPSQVKAGEVLSGTVFRVGGMVRQGSLKRIADTLEVEFLVTDNAHEIKVSHTGILPDLFKEGQGVVARGKLREDGVFVAEEVLAKHDENYMPPEVSAAMKEKKPQDTK